MTVILFWVGVLYIFYTYIGYPIILGLLSIFIRRVNYSEGYFPSVSLLIPAYNEATIIAKKIENSLEIDYPEGKIQILVAADGSDDDTPDIVAKYKDQGIELNFIPERLGKMAAINRAVEKCRGEIIVFSDANNFYDRDAIQKLIAPFQNPDVGSTTGAKFIIEEDRSLSASEGMYWKYESLIKKFETDLGSCITSVGEILAVRNSLFKQAPEGTINDDRVIILDLIKQGYDNIYVPEARSLEYVSPSAKDEITRRKRISAGSFQVIFAGGRYLPTNRPLEVWKILSHKYFRSFLPFAMILSFVTNLLLVVNPPLSESTSIWQMGYPVNWIFFVVQLAFYGIGFLGNWVELPGKLGKLLYLPTFLLNSNYALLAGLINYLKRSDYHLWERVARTEPKE